jgi:hypothetical protein
MTTTANTAPGPKRSRLGGALRGFASMPFQEKALLLAAWSLMAMAAGALQLVHFRRLAPFLGKPLDAVAWIPLANDQQIKDARMVRRAVLRAARVAPFRSDCLPQALVAATLCRHMGVPASVHLGVRLDQEPRAIAAHAWVCSGPEAVTGGRSFNAYTPVTCFAPPQDD